MNKKTKLIEEKARVTRTYLYIKLYKLHIVLFLFLFLSNDLISQVVISDLLNPGIVGSNPDELVEFDNRLFFTAIQNSEKSIYEFSSSTNIVVELNVPSGNFDPRELTVLNGKLFFSGESGSGRYLYELSPGSSTPTPIGNSAYNPVEFIVHNNHIYFAGGNELYEYDGINSLVSLGTFPNGFINRNAGNMENIYSEKSILVVNNKLVFHGNDGLYYCDINNPTIALACSVPSDLGAVDYQMSVLNNYVLYVSSFNYSSKSELVVVDFTPPIPSFIIENLNVGSFSLPRHFINYDSKIFFIAGVVNPYSATLHYFDVNGNITEVPSSPLSGSFGSSYDDPLKIIDGDLYFNNQQVMGPAPYSINAASCFAYPYFARNVIIKDGKFHYVGLSQTQEGYDIVRCDGVLSDTITCLKGLDNSIANMVLYDNQIYFTSVDFNSYGNEVFATTSDGTGLCYDDEITELPCIELIGKVKITNPVSAVGEFAILTQNPDGIISSIPLSTLSSEDADSDPLNEIQTLSISGNEISLSQGGGSVTILAGMDNLGSHIATQAVDMNAHGIINLSYPINGNDATTKAYVDAISINDADADPTNELQQIEISAMNDTIRISGSNDDFWILPGVSAANWAVDGSGNKYRIAKIGTQTWLRSNLRTTKYNDGTPIPNVTANASWAAWTAPAFCWYNNNPSIYTNPYGALYNQYVVDVASNGNKNVCPIGYHIPSDAEFQTLIVFLGTNPGGKLKTTSTENWNAPNTGATNQYLFSAYPVPYRDPNTGGFSSTTGSYAEYWTTTFAVTSFYYKRRLSHNNGTIDQITADKKQGISLRCLKD